MERPAPATVADRSLAAFVRDTTEKPLTEGRFTRQSDRLLRIEVDGGVWLKPGAAVAYRGDISFERLPTIDASSLTEAALREVSPLVRASGRGRLFCGYRGCHVQVVRLEGETIVVAWDDLLAFEQTLEFETTTVAHGISLAAGGLVVVRLSGHGALALAVHGVPLTFLVTPESPISTDPNATLAWSNGLTPTLKTDLSWRSLFGHGGQQAIQMFFQGTGFVIVQPFKTPRALPNPSKAIDSIASVIR